MNKQEYMRQLAAALSRIADDERESALEFYNEYFDEAGPEREQEVIASLGTPQKLASQIKAQCAARYLEREEKPTVKSGISAIWVVILGIFAAPIALPLAIAAAALVFSLVITVLALLFAAVLVTVALLLAGIALVAAGFSALVAGPATGLCLIGVGLALTGIMLLAGVLAFTAAAAFIRFLGRGLGRSFTGRTKEAGKKGVLKDE